MNIEKIVTDEMDRVIGRMGMATDMTRKLAMEMGMSQDTAYTHVKQIETNGLRAMQSTKQSLIDMARASHDTESFLSMLITSDLSIKSVATKINEAIVAEKLS